LLHCDIKIVIRTLNGKVLKIKNITCTLIRFCFYSFSKSFKGCHTKGPKPRDVQIFCSLDTDVELFVVKNLLRFFESYGVSVHTEQVARGVMGAEVVWIGYFAIGRGVNFPRFCEDVFCGRPPIVHLMLKNTVLFSKNH